MKCYPIFSEITKLADFIRVNYRLLDVLPRFGIGLGFQERTAEQICEENGISTQVFLLVCNVYTFDDYRPDEQTLEQLPTTKLLDFLSASHNDYREMQTRILDKAIELAGSGSDKHRKILVDVSERYRKLLRDHLDYEEQVEFPYIRALIKAKSPENVCRPKMTESDEELCVAFSDLQSLITKYLTDDSVETSRLYRDVLMDIALFYMDTDKHILLEDILMALYDRD